VQALFTPSVFVQCGHESTVPDDLSIRCPTQPGAPRHTFRRVDMQDFRATGELRWWTRPQVGWWPDQ
jgi:hypothetical protein